MSDLSTFCIVCASKKTLNTKMDVKNGAKKYTVAICGKCEDTATPKVVQGKLTEKLTNMKGLIAQAKEMGLDLSMEQLTGSGIVVPKAIEVKGDQPAGDTKSEETAQGQGQNQVAAIRRPLRQAGQAIKLVDEHGNRLSEQKTQKSMQTITRKDKVGHEHVIAIPSKVESNAGTLDIRISKFTDADLQRRAKQAAQKSTFSEGLGVNGQNYGQYSCNVCASTGIIKNGAIENICKKCAGTGFTDQIV